MSALSRLGLLLRWTVGLCLLAYILAWGKIAWDTRSLRHGFDALKDSARELGLTYDAILLATDRLSNKPVLWRLGRTGGYWHYEGDKGKPVLFTNPPDLPPQGHKGMDIYTILAVIRGAGPQGIFLEFIQAEEAESVAWSPDGP